ncbi:MAG TPA: AMP-binding protein [Acidimicrobiales bacterium]|nr:AMP-binding protein [Acidimicrobiales bacterium]
MSNLATIIDGHPDDAVAIVEGGSRTTYGELRTLVAAMRGGLVREGVQPGDRVALVLPNGLDFAAVYLAVLGVGAVAVPLNPTSPGPELAAEIGAVGTRVSVADGAAVEQALTPASLAGGDAVDVVDRADDDLAVLIFTAGTGGSPKAAMLSHGNLRANLDQIQRHPGREVGADDVTLGVLPLFHIFGLNVVLGLSLYTGASVVMVDRFDPAGSLQAIADNGVTVVAGAPPMYAAWARLAAANAGALVGVRLALTGAAPLSEETRIAFETRFGVTLRQGYGLTEASPVVTSSVFDGAPKPHSIGVPLPGVDVRLVDDEGQDALVGDSGEIWVHGANVFKGYWENDEATARALTPDGWLRTGDVAVADDDGFLAIVDRAKDLIIVSGFNVFPAEVEDTILEHPDIAEAAVVGVAHPHTGEAVKAFVVPETGSSVTESDVQAFCAGRLARYKCPTTVTFVDALPHGLAGKLLRRALR